MNRPRIYRLLQGGITANSETNQERAEVVRTLHALTPWAQATIGQEKEVLMMTVGQILANKKSPDLCTISPESSVIDALNLFAEHNLGALIVTEDGYLQGVVTERDYARKIALLGRSSRSTKVREIMSSQVIYVTPSSTIEECMQLMINRFIRHLPVLDGNQISGIVSIGDIVKANLGEKEFLIDELVRYITDSPMITLQHGATQISPSYTASDHSPALRH